MEGDDRLEEPSGRNQEISAYQNQANINQFRAYYPSQENRSGVHHHIKNLKSLQLTKHVNDLITNKKFLTPVFVAILIIAAVAFMFMIPQDTEPIEGQWIKSDGQLLTFDSDGEFHNQIYPGSTWSMDKEILSMFSTVQIIDEQNLVTKIIVQTVQVEFSDDEQAMWWVWKSVTIDGIEENLDQGTCSLMVKQSIAENTYEFAVESQNYQSIKPNGCQ